METKSPLKKQIFDLVGTVPKGKIVYFGQIGDKIGVTGQLVGWQLSGMNNQEMTAIPWYRVVAKNGFISSLKLGQKGLLQKQILLQEGYTITGDSVDMEKHKFEL
jgi:methylated-DNA-protein-cysteine methyltransferase-like protein